MGIGVRGPNPQALAPKVATAASVGVVSGQILAANPKRTSLRIVNTSTNRVSIGVGVAAILDSGMTLMPSGGTWNMDGLDFTTDAIHAIASGATSNLAIQEFDAVTNLPT